MGAATLAAGLSVTACGGATTPTHTESSIAGIPFYKPSHLEFHAGRSALLTTPDSVSKVSSFYVNQVDKTGWTTVSKSVTAFSGNLTVKKPGQGATISISPSGSGSRVSISAYPT
ncbi:MAG: hypothetical protein J2P27_02965 [Actinobacteria bacterium]|nr:hypothetical protein [Actinomycetota bacterium]